MIQGFRPLYSQVKDLLLSRISEGHWSPGSALPAEPRLAEELGVSAGTVRKALDELAAQSVVIRRQGRGTFVAEQTPDRSLFHFFQIVDARGQRLIPGSEKIRVALAQPSRGQQEALRLPEKEGVWKVERIRTLEKRPMINETLVLPQSLFPGLNELASTLPNTLYAFYQSRFGIFVQRATESLRAVQATRADARRLEVEPGVPLLEIDRTAFDLNSTPVEWRRSRILTEGCRYRVELS
jgi:GntR family transcriptional regulator